MKEASERENESQVYTWSASEERLVRSERCINESLRYRYEGCERLYKSKAGLVRHESMMHWKLEERMRFVSESCDLESSTKGALISHWRT